MNKKVFVFICAGLVIFSLGLWGWGCSKKSETSELESSFSPSAASAPTDVIVINPTTPSFSNSVSSSSSQMADLSTPEMSVAPVMSEEEKRISRNKDIQTALRNTGFYNGEVDGKIGPMTRKAIKDFQASKGLTADGKVGPKTWAELEKYLNPSPDTKKNKKRS